jgi:hypothetical protein
MMIARCGADVRVTEIAAKSILNRVSGIPFGWSINPYAGCAHQCVFCYARATHAYRDLDGVVLRDELKRYRHKVREVAEPIHIKEGKYRITRNILIELSRARDPVRRPADDRTAASKRALHGDGLTTTPWKHCIALADALGETANPPAAGTSASRNCLQKRPRAAAPSSRPRPANGGHVWDTPSQGRRRSAGQRSVRLARSLSEYAR